jgi:hypothetical protein
MRGACIKHGRDEKGNILVDQHERKRSLESSRHREENNIIMNRV